MNKQQIFSAWAPSDSIWSPWVKPVLFSYLSTVNSDAPPATVDVAWTPVADGTTAIVVDLPGVHSVEVGMSLVAIGYRPIPLFNACPETQADTPLVQVRPIMNALAGATSTLIKANLPSNAPPVFLLDSNRGRAQVLAQPGMLDNRSISLPTDFPSGNVLSNVGIKKILLVQASGSTPQSDLSHTLVRWQKAGLPIFCKSLDVANNSMAITVQTPRAFRVLWYNLMATIGLTVNPLGGFGGVLPIPGAG